MATELVNLLRQYAEVFGEDDGAKIYTMAADEIERLRQALKDITDPVQAIRRDLGPNHKVNGAIVVRMSEDPQYLKDMAKDALKVQPDVS